MTRKARFVFNTLAPAVLATVIMSLPTLFFSVALGLDPSDRTNSGLGSFVAGFVMILVFAYALGLVPSLIHAGLMDAATRKWAGPVHEDRRKVAYTASGAIAGGLITVSFGAIYGFSYSLAVFFGAVGALTGFLNGILVAQFDRRRAA